MREKSSLLHMVGGMDRRPDAGFDVYAREAQSTGWQSMIFSTQTSRVEDC